MSPLALTIASIVVVAWWAGSPRSLRLVRLVPQDTELQKRASIAKPERFVNRGDGAPPPLEAMQSKDVLFAQIEKDLDPFRARGVSLEHVEHIYCNTDKQVRVKCINTSS